MGGAHSINNARGGSTTPRTSGATTRNVEAKRVGVPGAAAHSGPRVAPKALSKERVHGSPINHVTATT